MVHDFVRLYVPFYFLSLLYCSFVHCAIVRSLLVNYYTSSKFGRIVQKLGLPEPPKRPINGYIRFQQDNQAALKQSAKSQQDFMVLVGAKWRDLSADEKEKYGKSFTTEIVSDKYLRVLSTDERFRLTLPFSFGHRRIIRKNLRIIWRNCHRNKGQRLKRD